MDGKARIYCPRPLTMTLAERSIFEYDITSMARARIWLMGQRIGRASSRNRKIVLYVFVSLGPKY
jgi:hypothetical protein